MINKFEALGIGISIAAMIVALYLVRIEVTNQTATAISSNAGDTDPSVFIADGDNRRAAVADAVIDASSESGDLERLIIDDIVIGEGEAVSAGDRVTVQYIGTLTSGQQFDNSYERGEAFTFTVGDGKVIRGWDEGVVGMRAGGERILVIPSALAYGEDGFGPIPGGATLVFAIELLSINE
ncbi:FKBP-type peptidyl-prolyl cis-trans isomerase [Candidatus Pacebacteria bacterium]|nr:FKBP-type peptidyl-prolyl cis-trans isomerase [Candidatus Paceibacterota bacterium]